MAEDVEAMAPAADAERRRFIVSLIDVTSLREEDRPEHIAALCEALPTACGLPAALCFYRQFLPLADKILSAKGLRSQVRLATVANFPAGNADSSRAAAEVSAALALGADEVDIVFPYRALMQGDSGAGRALVRAARAAAGNKVLKVIIESGVLHRPRWIKQATEIALGEGADFIKTSTGKAAVHATIPAARLILAGIAQHNRACGLKLAGGLRTRQQAEAYLALAEAIMGRGWLDPARFRFGSSALLPALLAPAGAKALSSVDKAAPAPESAALAVYQVSATE